MSPAPISSTTAIAMSAATSNRRAKEVGACAVRRATPCSDPCRSIRDALIAGIRPKRNAVASDNAIENASARPSMCAPASRDTAGARLTSSGTVTKLTSRPSAPPAKASRPLSTISWRTMRARLAPRRRAQREIALAAGDAREQQAGHIGAGDQQNEADCAHQHAERGAHAAGQLIGEGKKRHRPCGVVRRVLAAQLRLDRVDVGARGLQRSLGLQPAEGLQVLAVAARVG